MSILDEILEYKKQEVALLKKERPLKTIEAAAQNNSFIKKINESRQNFHLICEVKKASPSKGVIRSDFKPLEIARAYKNGGASAISVLTDEKYFMGKPEYLQEIKKDISLPILRKDFIVDEYQIIESKIWNADIILLIAKALEKSQIDDYIGLAAALKMDVLLEFSSAGELDKIPANYENVIFGINNRDLHTFTVDINNSLHLKKILPADAIVISESGIKTNKDCTLLAEAGFKGALIGETLMRSDDIGKEISMLKNGI
jgi:indole-3-glycerol phosphate synthase